METTPRKKNGKPVSATHHSLDFQHPPPPEAKEIDPATLRGMLDGKTKETSTKIVIPRIEFALIDVPIVQVEDSPYLVAGWTVKAMRMMEVSMTSTAPKPPKSAREKRNPEEEFEAYKVRNADGKECIPGLHIKCAMVNAGIRSTTGIYKPDIRAAVFVRGSLIPFEYEKCVMRRDMVRNKSGQPDIRWRPEYHGWKATIPLRINTSLMTVSTAVNLLNLAGSMVGLGEWRVEKGGEHGQFRVAL